MDIIAFAFISPAVFSIIVVLLVMYYEVVCYQKEVSQVITFIVEKVLIPISAISAVIGGMMLLIVSAII
ncbi:hypothetical protein [Shewanella sp. T24-MNA-CIBAN-0130]|uniref:hypothetical protein n=1 Tax=Shewanella sp. T24-MNA-CIBAN-0130 TaxID=3140470 RepID=UPI00332554BD